MIYVVLPAYNEEAGLARLLPAIAHVLDSGPEPYRVIVVDDGSDDRTADVAGAHGPWVDIVRHACNQGLGPTLRDGLFAALAEAAEGDVIVTLDADDSHDPGVIPSMARKIRDGYDVIIGSRYQSGSATLGVGPLRTATSWGASLLMRLALPTEGVRDFTCGFRAYRAAALRTAVQRNPGAFQRLNGFECMVDLLLQLRRLRARFGEVPMVLRYDRKQSASRMRVWRTITDTLALIAKELSRPSRRYL